MGAREDRFAIHQASGRRPEAAGPLQKATAPGGSRGSASTSAQSRAPHASAAFTCTFRSSCSPGVLRSSPELKNG